MKVYIDNNGNIPIMMPYKGKTVTDSASFYCPYIPLNYHEAHVVQGKVFGWTTFIINDPDVIRWCEENLGRRFRGSMHTIFGWRLSNWGRWFHDNTESGVKIFLRRDDDIALFKMRWL